jgi:SanA protein
MLAGFGAWYYYTCSATNSRIFGDIEKVVPHDVALVLGTSKYLRNGWANPYFYNRVDAAAELYLKGKVKKILVSGDNAHITYNEPMDMLRALMAKGICKEDIILDYAGFRTFDSMIRAREVFGQNSFIVVSQKFQLQRALYIGEAKNMDVIGYEAKDPDISKKVMVREVFARTKAFLDCYILGTAPRYLGAKEAIEV